MDIVGRKPTIGVASRRQVLKGGTALGLSGLALTSGMTRKAALAQGSRIKVNVILGGGSLSLLMNVIFEELKFFDKYGVEARVLNVADASKILAGLISGDSDICAGAGFTGVFPAVERGAKVKILAAANISPLNILYSSKPDIKSVKDLPGRTVGTGALGSLLHQQAVAVMKKYGVDYKQVKFVNVGSSSDVFRALAAGVVDAGVAPVEHSVDAAKYKLAPLTDGQMWQELPLYTNQAMYASDKAIAEKREALVRTMAAYADLFRWIDRQENKDAFINFYKKIAPKASDEEALFLQQFLSRPGALATELVMNEKQINYIQDLNVELGSQKVILPFDRCADMSLAQEAVKLIKA